MKSYRRPRFLSETCPDCKAPAGRVCLGGKRKAKKPCNILCGPISLSPRLRQLTFDDLPTLSPVGNDQDATPDSKGGRDAPA